MISKERKEKISKIPIPADLLETAKKYHNELIEKIVETDETAMGEYLDGKEISVDRLKKLLRTATIKVQIVPVFAGSVLKIKVFSWCLMVLLTIFHLHRYSSCKGMIKHW